MARQDDRGGIGPRKAALALVAGVMADGALVPEMVGAGALAHMPPEGRARAQRLAMDLLRGMDRADRVLKPYVTKSPPLAVRNVLRLGVIEVAQGGAAHGIVNAMVEIVGSSKRTRNYKGLVNAVMRRVAEAGPDAWARQPVPKLPGWLRQPLVAAWGREAVAAMEAVQFASPPLDLSCKGDPAALAVRLGGAVMPGGSVRLSGPVQVSALDGYADGEWWVQDAAAAMPVRMLGDVAGLRVLDLCAAPGGKTMQLAAGGADVTAVDDSAARMERLSENLARTGQKAEVVVSDVMDVAGKWDAVVLDAPCSATGTIRRHPDLPHAKDGAEFGALIAQQERMMDHALGLLSPGGRLIYCTCSLLPDEGEVQVEEALARHAGLIVEDVLPEGASSQWRSEEGGIRTRPDFWAEQGGMDGFYMACLRKPG